MQGYRDDGVVLRTQKLGEADRIITLLTRHHGRVRAVAKGDQADEVEVRRPARAVHARRRMVHNGRSLDVITQAEVIRAYGTPLASDYPKYTAGTAMLETAERFTPVEKEPAIRQFLLLIGGLRALGEAVDPGAPVPTATLPASPLSRLTGASPAATRRDPRMVLDAYFLRSLTFAGYAPALEECARCGATRRRARRRGRQRRQAPRGVRRPGGRHGLRRLPAAGFRVARAADGGADGRAAAGRLGRSDAERTQAPGRVQWPGGRVPAVAPGAFDPVVASCGACLSKSPRSREPRPVQPPYPHPSGIRPPEIPRELVPRHVAIVMDGDGRWAKERGLPRTEGHKVGESALMDVLMGAIELGVKYISAYAFSTENWRRHPDEVAFLMSFNRDVIHRRREELAAAGVRIRWAGRKPRLWRSVIRELEDAEQLSEENTVLTLQFCCNYGGRAEILDATAAIASDVAAGQAPPRQDRRGTVPPVPRRAGCSRRRPVGAFLGRAAAIQFPALAVGLCRACLSRHALARFRPAASLACLRNLRLKGSPIRRRDPELRRQSHNTSSVTVSSQRILGTMSSGCAGIVG